MKPRKVLNCDLSWVTSVGFKKKLTVSEEINNFERIIHKVVVQLILRENTYLVDRVWRFISKLNELNR